MPEPIFLNKEQFYKFINSMKKLDLKRKPNDESSFPLDFIVFYKDRYILNFEYLSGSLEFYFIGKVNNGKESYFKSDKDVGGNSSLLPEIRNKIMEIIS